MDIHGRTALVTGANRGLGRHLAEQLRDRGPSCMPQPATPRRSHVMLALSAWGDRWLDEGTGQPIRITHAVCGHDAGPRVSCAHFDGDLDAGDLRAEPGPGFPVNGPTTFPLDH